MFRTFFALVLLGSTAHAQIEHARELRVMGKYTEARTEFTALLEHADPESMMGAVLLDNLALTEQDLGHYSEAERLLTRAASVLQKAGSEAGRVMALEHLGEVYLEQGRAQDAQPLFRLALEAHGDIPERRAIDLVDLAICERYGGKLSRAENLLRQALALLEKHYGPDDPMLSAALAPLGAILTHDGRYAEALAVTERTWNILTANPQVPEADLLNTMSTLGSLYAADGQYAKGDLYGAMAVNKAEAIYGPGHRRTGLHLAAYAAILRREGHKAEAKRVEDRSRAILAASRQANPTVHTVNASSLR